MSDSLPLQPEPASGQVAARMATLARDLGDFLVEFSIVLHKRSLYPGGHPYLQESAGRFIERLEALLDRRETLAIGVARHQLIIGGVATDARNALLSDLARRLHRQRVASISFERGVQREEIEELLQNLSGELGEDSGPLGLRLERATAWRHVKVQAPELGRLLLDEHADGGPRQAPADTADELWLSLANLALSAEGNAGAQAADPLVVARAIDEQVGQVAYDRVVLDYLGQMAEEISGRVGTGKSLARERVSRLMAGLRPETLRGLLEAGADHAERRRFALTASEVLAVDAVVEVVEAAAATTGQHISNHLLRLLHKFAHHAEHTGGGARAEAESALRENVARIIAGWELADPNPAEYTAVLEGMVRVAPTERSPALEAGAEEAEAVLQIALESGSSGPRVHRAVDRLLAEGRFSRVAALLANAPEPAAATALWAGIATVPRLRAQLAARPVDFTVVEGLALRLGGAAADAILDCLEGAEDTTGRARALKVLAAIGPATLAPAAARFAQAPWYVQRNILVLHQSLRGWPTAFSPISCTRHAHPQVRREAYKLLLSFPKHRASALAHGLQDKDEGIVRLMLLATLEACPPEAFRAVEALLDRGHHSPELRGLAVRVLARASTPEALTRLVGLAAERRRFRGWRLAAKSPIVLAALEALAHYWPSDPRAAGLLTLARQHPDPDVRLAAQGLA